MQTWITEFKYQDSARNLDRRRLFANIYEGIHILASLLDMEEHLVTPKRSVKNHPAAKLWKGYENQLFLYLIYHLLEWDSRGYSSPVNWENIGRLSNYIPEQRGGYPSWISKEVIETHRNVLLKKKPEFYGKLWTPSGRFMEMRYDWRETA